MFKRWIFLVVLILMGQVSPANAAGAVAKFTVYKLLNASGTTLSCTAVGRIDTSIPANVSVTGDTISGTSSNYPPFNPSSIIRVPFCSITSVTVNATIVTLTVQEEKHVLTQIRPDLYAPYRSVGVPITNNLRQQIAGGKVEMDMSAATTRLFALKGDTLDVCIELSFSSTEFILRGESCTALVTRGAVLLGPDSSRNPIFGYSKKGNFQYLSKPSSFVVVSQEVVQIQSADFDTPLFLPVGTPVIAAVETPNFFAYPVFAGYWDTKCKSHERSANIGIAFDPVSATYQFLGTEFDKPCRF